MAKRGPDGAGAVLFDDARAGPVWLGHRRLAIQDLSDSAAQPMESDCGRFTITYNGEVYNAPSLRAELIEEGRSFRSTSDTEVIVNGFAAWGPSLVHRLIGMFSFAIWDSHAGELFVARDRVGIKPLHYVSHENGIVLASDANALRCLGLASDIDRDSLAAYLILGYTPAPMSIWQGVQKLPGGSTLTWRRGTPAKVSRYWEPPRFPIHDSDVVSDSRTQQAEIETFGELVDQVVKDHLLSDVPLGVFLSGGIDSSLIASSLSRLGQSINALTIAYPSSTSDDEAPIARRTASTLGLPWRSLSLEPSTASYYFAKAFSALDEPLAFSAIVSQAAVSELASKEYKVVLSGDGGDELFGGYNWHQDLERLSPTETDDNLLISFLKRRLLTPLLSIFAPRIASRQADRSAASAFARRSPLHAHIRRIFPALRPDEVSDLIGGISESQADEVALAALRRWDAPDLPLKRRLQRIDLMTFCQDSILPKVDRTAMSVGLEVRPPLLDHRLIDHCLGLPITDLRDGKPKGIARAILKQRGLGVLLEEKKRGFSLKDASPYSIKEMAAAATRYARGGLLPVSVDWQERIEEQSEVYKLKAQALYFFGRWRDTTLVPTDDPVTTASPVPEAMPSQARSE